MRYGDVEVTVEDGIATLEIQRPPNNFFDVALIESLVEAFQALDEHDETRVLLLAAQGKHFCAGADFSRPASLPLSADPEMAGRNPLYVAAVRLFECRKPVVGAIQGAAVGGGFGLALVPDFRVVTPTTRFTANFVKLGFHPGFGLTHTLPRLIGSQRANLLFQTGRRIDGQTAFEWGLAEVLTDESKLRSEARMLAAEIAENAPLAVESVRATMRDGLADAVRRQTDHEFAEQERLKQTEDHAEGVRAVAERRPGNFVRG